MKIRQRFWSLRLHSEVKEIIPSEPPPWVLTTAILMLVLTRPVFAGSATWNLNPTSGDWNAAANWTPVTVPNGPNDTATFDISNATGVSLSSDVEVSEIVFNAGAGAFTISSNAIFALRNNFLTISGGGITNNSGITQGFVAAPRSSGPGGGIGFRHNATAGIGTSFTTVCASSSFDRPPMTQFLDNSSAGYGIFTNQGGVSFGLAGGVIEFRGNSTAANGTFFNNGSRWPVGATGGTTKFFDTATAGNATLIATHGESAGGSIVFLDDSTGGTAHVAVFGNADLQIHSHNPPGVTIDSLEGNGAVFLGDNNLTVGGNDVSKTFPG